MKLLRYVIYILLGILIAACSGSGSDQAKAKNQGVATSKIYRWKMVTTWPANFPIFQESADRFAEAVRVMSNGRMQIQVFAGGELVPALQTFDAVSQGSVELGLGSPYYWAGKIPAAQFFSTVPFGMTARGMHAWVDHGGGLELWRDLYKPFHVLPFPMGNSGVQMGGWFNKKIETLDDLKGLRMRIPGLGGKVLKMAGGNPVLMAGGEIYTALERGIIDATEWVGPFHDFRLGLNRAAKYYYYPGWHEPGTEFELLVNTDKWQQLPDDLKKMIETAAAATSEWVYSAMEYHNSVALQKLRADPSVQILEFPEAVLKELKQLTAKTLEEEASADEDFKRVYDSYRAFRKQYEDWSEISERSYQRIKDN